MKRVREKEEERKKNSHERYETNVEETRQPTDSNESTNWLNNKIEIKRRTGLLISTSITCKSHKFKLILFVVSENFPTNET